MKSLILLFLCILAAVINVKAISGGESAKPHSAPFMVNFRRKNPTEIFCGGVIIKNNIVLTAASHCDWYDFEEVTITAGDHNVHIAEVSEQKRSIVKFIKHPDNLGNLYAPSNIAIVYVNLPFDFNEYVQPIALPEIDQCFDGETISYGWGLIDNVNYPDVLQQLELKIINRNLCKEKVMIDFTLSSTTICTWEENALKAMYMYDFGGPVIQINKIGKPYLIGIMGFVGYPNSQMSAPSLFANVAALREFIDETIKIN